MTDSAALGVDVGGTFTDLVMWDGTSVTTGKVPTTPDQSEGVVEGALDVGGVRSHRFLHGTTVATNALLERKGATTALITTEGFADVLEIARQDRPSLYDSSVDRPEPLVPRHLRFEVDREDPEPADSLRTRIALAGSRQPVAGSPVESIAISLLYGYELAGREQAIAESIRERHPDLPISLSSNVAPEFREFERTSTTVLNAYLKPVVGSYLNRLLARAAESGLPPDVAVMRSSGGLLPAGEVADLPVAALLSGPAGGVVAAGALGDALGREHVLSFDMGGTSTDVCRIDNGRPEIAYGRSIDGYACLQPATSIHTVGAGGGSIAWLDAGGSLRVGPQSAGAEPGPAAYGRGGVLPTVTDANVILGRIDPSGSLAGRLRLRLDLAMRAMATVGEPLSLGVREAAGGVVRVVDEVMTGALRTVSVEQGSDPRDAALIAFGGAGGLHATALARSLDMAGVIVPAHAGVFSALGLLLSPPRVDDARSVMLRADRAAFLDPAITHVRDAATNKLRGASGSPGRVVSFVDVRYEGQAHEIAVPYEAGDGWEGLAERFHELHRRRNGFARTADPIEAVTVRAEATGAAAISWDDLPRFDPQGESALADREVAGRDGPVVANVFRRPGLAPGSEIVGPAVIEETEATTFLDRGERARVHDSGALEIEW